MYSHIGINFGHASSIAAVNAYGELVFGVEEGKVIGEKDTSNFPWKSIDLLHDFVDIDCLQFAEAWHIYKRFFLKGVYQTFSYGFKDKYYFSHRLKKEFFRLYAGLQNYHTIKKRFNNKKILFAGHHLTHAYSLLPIGLQNNSLVFVSDTTGEYESISTFHWNGVDMTLLTKSIFPNSIGSIYHQFATHLGFKGRNAPGTLMALSAYGKAKWQNELNAFTKFDNNTFKVVKSTYPHWKIADTWQLYAEMLPKSLFKDEIIASKNNFSQGIDIAASIQQWFVETTWRNIEQVITMARNDLNLKIDYLGLVGGCALNCQANGEFSRRIKKIGIEKLIVSPWSDDSGTSIGAAIYSYLQHSKNKEITIATPFLGHSRATTNNNNSLSNDVELAAEALINGQMIALISGSLEFGPRALGNRCILANPIFPNMQKQLNKIKQRFDFMPFAPAVLQSDYNLFFHDAASNYMTWTVQAKEKAFQEIPSAIHIDGSARVQLVEDSANSLLAQILKKVKQETNIGVLLLTSLNKKNKPFNYMHEDAINTSKELGLYGIISDLGWEKI